MSHTRQPRTGAYFEITPRRDNSSRPPLRRRTIDYLDRGAIDYRDHSQATGAEIIAPGETFRGTSQQRLIAPVPPPLVLDAVCHGRWRWEELCLKLHDWLRTSV
jgi:hypothetical protein